MPGTDPNPDVRVDHREAMDPIRLPDGMTYKVVPTSLGECRSFQITVGTRAGYQQGATQADIESVRAAALEWMKERAAARQPYLTGVLTAGDVLYAYPTENGGAAQHEPVVLFQGEVSTLYNRDLTDEQVLGLLNDLAARLAKSTEQTRVYIRFKAETWVIQKEGSSTPRGDTV